MLRQGIPAVVLVTERFVELARVTLASRKMPEAPVVILPATEETEYSDIATMTRVADEALAGVVRAVVAPAARTA